MESWKQEFEKYLPEVESFLTSVLLEETNVEITSSETKESEAAFSSLQKTDVFLFTRDKTMGADIILILDQEWYGLLSSIMLGVEEKTNNEITRDLLKKFSGELSVSLVKKLGADGYSPELDDIRVFTIVQARKELNHAEYQLMKLEVEGLADNKVRAEILIGNPEAQLNEAAEESEMKDKDEAGSEKPKANGTAAGVASEQGEFNPTDAEEMEKMGSHEEVISGRHVEFDDFEEDVPVFQNGNGRSMDMLKDVEMDVSVELGRIELPLGKVLQLSKGSVIELEKLAGEPVDILVNGQCIAHGEVVVIDEHFGVRISNLITTRQRLAGIR
jgi:flagellar motor switch protein FliN